MTKLSNDSAGRIAVADYLQNGRLVGHFPLAGLSRSCLLACPNTLGLLYHFLFSSRVF